MNLLASLSKYIRFLSLDVALGGAILSAAIARFLGVDLPDAVPICLAIAIWIIYTIDHLIDAFKSTGDPTIGRHLFHRTYAKWLIGAVVLAVLAGGYVLLALPAITLLYGVGMVLLVLVYFVLIYFFRGFYLKEIFVAMVYAMGVFVGPVSLNFGQVPPLTVLLFLQVLLVAQINLILFSFFEKKLDEMDKHPSLVLKMGDESVSKLLKVLFALLVVIQCFTLIDFGTDLSSILFQLLFISMGLILLTLYSWPQKFLANDRYRMIGDGIFFLPGIWLLFSSI